MPTTPKQFRLTSADLADLDRVVKMLAEINGGSPSRADAIRAGSRAYLALNKESGKKRSAKQKSA
jgi:hypothetical protein